MRFKQLFVAAAAVATACAPAVAHGQGEPGPPFGRLVNLDAPGSLDHGVLAGTVDTRIFGGDEGLLYTSLAAHLGMGRGWEGILRGAFADRKTLALPGGAGIRHGGSDVEMLAKYAPRSSATAGSHPASVAGLIGVSFPSTPSVGDTHLTLGLSASAPIGHGSLIFVNPRAVLIQDNTIVGVGLGARVRLSDRLAIVADYTPILSGDNTRDTSSGATKRRDLYGVALRFWRPDDRFSLDLGFTNGTGSTTGFSLTPGLGGSGAFYIALMARR